MSSNIGTLPLPAGKSRSWLAAPLALLAALLIAAGVAGYVALRDEGPAASSAAISQSAAIADRSAALAVQARPQEPFSSFPSVAAFERQMAVYGNSVALGLPGAALAELRGVDVFGLGTAGFWATTGSIEGAHSSAPASKGCRFVRHGPC